MALPPLQIISSMATQRLLADLVAGYTAQTRVVVTALAVGGVEAVRRLQAGETFDVVILAASAIEQLTTGGHIVPGSRIDVVDSGVAVAVRAGCPLPAIGDEAALKAAVLAAPRLGFSTGPSGVQLAKLFERWGISGQIAHRMVTAPPGTPVGELVARGEIDLGFQQFSELMHLAGITVVGPLPPAVQITTTFSAGICSRSAQPDLARHLLSFLSSPDVDALKLQHGMVAAAR